MQRARVLEGNSRSGHLRAKVMIFTLTGISSVPSMQTHPLNPDGSRGGSAVYSFHGWKCQEGTKNSKCLAGVIPGWKQQNRESNPPQGHAGPQAPPSHAPPIGPAPGSAPTTAPPFLAPPFLAPPCALGLDSTEKSKAKTS